MVYNARFKTCLAGSRFLCGNSMDGSQHRFHVTRMRVTTWYPMGLGLAPQLSLLSNFTPNTCYDGPHSHMGFNEMSTTGNFHCPLVIIVFFKAFVLMAFGLTRGHPEKSISSVAHAWFGVCCWSAFELNSFGGLEVCSTEETKLINNHFPVCCGAILGSFELGGAGDLQPDKLSQKVKQLVMP